MTHRQDSADLVTKPQVAEMLQVSLRTVDRYIAKGELPKFKYHNGAVRFSTRDVRALQTPTEAPALSSSPEHDERAGASSRSGPPRTKEAA